MSHPIPYQGRPTLMPPKDPDAVLSYGMDWTDYLGEEDILTSTWEADTGLTVGVDSISTDKKQTAVMVSGGTVGKRYDLTNRITFTGADGQQVDDRTMIISVRQL